MLTLSVPLTMPYARPRQFAAPTLYQALSPLESFLHAIRASKPDLIVPGDDLASKHLHDLYFREERNGGEGQKVCDLIESLYRSTRQFPGRQCQSFFYGYR